MNLILDTHTFMWWDSAPSQLPKEILRLCHDENNTLILSIASVWEMQIKSQLGKLTLNMPLPDLVASQQELNNIQVLPINLAHVLWLNNLPLHHNDPFDRLLIAQAIVEEAVLLSKDLAFSAYPVKVIW